MAALFNFYRENTLNHETHEIHEKNVLRAPAPSREKL